MKIVDLQYFPPVSFFFTSFNETKLHFLLYDTYSKMSFSNRCLIAGANNIIGLSIPLKGGRQQKGAMKEIRLSAGEAWQKQHWKSLHSAYSNSAFFEHYADELETIYRKPVTWLADWNQMCMEWISTKTGFPPELKFVTDPRDPEPGSIVGDDPANDLRKKLLPKNYASFPAPVYNQVFENINGFQANLSVLDLLFNTGPAAGLILQGNKDNKKNGLQF